MCLALYLVLDTRKMSEMLSLTSEDFEDSGKSKHMDNGSSVDISYCNNKPLFTTFHVLNSQSCVGSHLTPSTTQRGKFCFYLFSGQEKMSMKKLSNVPELIVNRGRTGIQIQLCPASAPHGTLHGPDMQSAAGAQMKGQLIPPCGRGAEEHREIFTEAVFTESKRMK